MEPWHPFEQKCIQVIPEMKSWEKAKDHCTTMKSILAVPDNVKALGSFYEFRSTYLPKKGH